MLSKHHYIFQCLNVKLEVCIGLGILVKMGAPVATILSSNSVLHLSAINIVHTAAFYASSCCVSEKQKIRHR